MNESGARSKRRRSRKGWPDFLNKESEKAKTVVAEGDSSISFSTTSTASIMTLRGTSYRSFPSLLLSRQRKSHTGHLSPFPRRAAPATLWSDEDGILAPTMRSRRLDRVVERRWDLGTNDEESKTGQVPHYTHQLAAHRTLECCDFAVAKANFALHIVCCRLVSPERRCQG
ncbi:hypothetical protein VNO80_16412 [Phaseolus coccineus]|uniref:Uncharacterized protein n=1 Tax=Phaseolus coccineus TaxID=3886 RepID=A0AAN9MQZ8_PHACN